MQNFLNKRTDDKRSPSQIILTQKLTSKLTQLNLKRLNINEKNLSSTLRAADRISTNKINQIQNQQILFVCVSGIPPFENQFENLNLPGQKLHIVLPGFQLDLDQQGMMNRARICDLNTLSQQINIKIKKYPIDYSLVFIYHSFGTFITSYYFKNYYEQQKHRIKGIIELGAAPGRVYKLIEPGIQVSLPMTKQFIEQNIDYIYQKFKQLQQKWKTQSNIITSLYKSKYSIMSLFFSYKTQGFHEIFDRTKRFPKILKLFIYGEKDAVFEAKSLDQKAIFYLYNQEAQLNKEYTKELSQKYFRIHGRTASNIQQKYIYKIQNGKHSLHMQKQLIPLIQKIIDDYLQLIF